METFKRVFASEAASLAGTLRLSKLIYLYDDNDISIEGNTDIAFAENVAQRFQAYGWHVIGPIDGMDFECVDSALRMARAENSRPSLIICRTIIGYGSPNKQGTGSAHGEPLGRGGGGGSPRRTLDGPIRNPSQCLKRRCRISGWRRTGAKASSKRGWPG